MTLTLTIIISTIMSLQLQEIIGQFQSYQSNLANRISVLDEYNWQANRRAQLLYDTALMCRMRPFADVMLGQARMVRDLGRSLGKQVQLRIEGENTQVDRDVLKRLEAPLIHLLRNAVDHAIESPEQRLQAGKSSEGLIIVRAYHHADKLRVEVEDDGHGIDLQSLRQTIVKKQLTNQQTAAQQQRTHTPPPRAAQELPAEKIVLGSDEPEVDVRLEVFKIRVLKLPKEKENQDLRFRPIFCPE